MFDKQTKKFCSAVVENLPITPGRWMQYLISHPKELQHRLMALLPPLLQALSERNDIELIEVAPSLDVMILRSKLCPEVGIAVSCTHFSGSRDRLVLENGEPICIPCGCCDWEYHSNLPRPDAVRLVREACRTASISKLIFESWSSSFRQDEGDLRLISPQGREQMRELPENFFEAFDWLKYKRAQVNQDQPPSIVPLTALK